MSQATSGESQSVITMRYSQGDLAILSAETYDPGLNRLPFLPSSLQSSKKTRQQQQQQSSSASQDGPRKRAKRQSPDSGDRDDEEKKRSRGRPRLDIKDETAADRRRTQIRLAQRAYRNRKENAIQTLERRVQELKDTNEEMSNAFMRLHDFAVNNGLVDQAPEFGRQLRSTTEKFLNLARISSEDAARLEDPDGSPRHESAQEFVSRIENASTHPEPTPDLGFSAAKQNQQLYGGIVISHEPLQHDNLFHNFTTANLTASLPPATSTSTSSLPAYEIITQPTLENASFPIPFDIPSSTTDFDFTFSNPDLTNSSTFQTTSTNTSPNPLPSFPPSSTSTGTGTGSTPLFHTLPPPTSYAAHEATFGRRLQRTGIERALLLLTMRDPPQRSFNRVFGFCLLLESRDAIHRRLLRGAHRTAAESLSNWHFPFFHLGGAGTHHHQVPPNAGQEPVGNKGTLDVMKPAVTSGGYNIGPFGEEVNVVRDMCLDEGMRIKGCEGFQGEFFDCDEVELYLWRRGVRIPPAADFITAEVDGLEFSEGEGGGGSSRGRSPLSTGAGTGGTTALSTDGVTGSSPGDAPSSGSASTWGALGGTDPSAATAPIEFDMGLAAADGGSDSSSGNGMMGGFSQQQIPPPPAPTRKVVRVDINLLVYELTERAVCLGRTPGIRQADVNRAFWRASQVIS